MIALTLLLNFALAFFATCGFAIVFNAPKRELLFCGLTGGLGWMVLKSVVLFDGAFLVAATLCGSVIVTFMSRSMAYMRRVPASVYLVSGIIPLVPGTTIFQAMQSVFILENAGAMSKVVEVLKLAGVIIIGIVIILSIPWKVFHVIMMPLEKLFIRNPRE